MIDLKEILNILVSKGHYADVLFLDIENFTIRKDNSGLDIDKDNDKGIKMRVFDGNQFYEYGTDNLDIKYLKKKAKELINELPEKIIGGKLPREKLSREKLSGKKLSGGKLSGKELFEKCISLESKKLVKNFKFKKNKISFTKKIKDVNEFYNKIKKYDKRIINSRVVYREMYEKRIFLSSKKELSQELGGSQFVLVPMVMSDGVRYCYESNFSTKYNADVIRKKINKTCKMALRLIDAKRIKPGKYMTILSPGISGLLAHESFGHGMESDTIYKNRAKAAEYFGKKIAPSNVSILDSPIVSKKHGYYYFDDEGCLSGKTYMVKKGIVIAPITEMYSSFMGGFERSANGRIESFDHKTYARMSNTYFDKGKTPFSKMLKSVKDGILLHNGGGGMEDPKGWGVQLQGVIGERIKNGKLTGELYYEIGITGFLPEILSNIVEVGDKLIIEGTGHCGKGHKEWVRVSEGGPYLKIKNFNLA